jgi:hypothetical protein
MALSSRGAAQAREATMTAEPNKSIPKTVLTMTPLLVHLPPSNFKV